MSVMLLFVGGDRVTKLADKRRIKRFSLLFRLH